MEIGTGSGWNAALLSDIVGQEGKVYSLEIVKELAEQAKEKLKDYKNAEVFHVDGSRGLPEYAPYDKIILTAAPKEMAEEWKKELKNDGIFLAPIGEYFQKLVKIRKKGSEFIYENKGNFVFVPLVSTR